MGMPDLARFWTRDEVLALPEDGNRYELVDGELLVTPSPRPVHQLGVVALLALIRPYVEAHGLGRTFIAPADLDLLSGQVVQPDVFVTRLADGRVPARWTEVGIPLLVAEILSPGTARHDRFTKRRRYQQSGVPTYWVVDLESRMVESWTPGGVRPTMIDDQLRWEPGGGAPPLLIDLPNFFRDVWGE